MRTTIRKSISGLMVTSFLFVTACGGGEHPRTASDPGPGYTKDYMVDLYTGFDDNGRIRPERNLTYTENLMLGEIDRHCVAKTHEVDQQWLEYGKTSLKAGFLQGLGVAVGAVLGGFTKGPVSFTDYLGYGGGAGLGSGLFTADQKREQALKIVHSYCVLLWVDRNRTDPVDKRLRDVIIIPMMIGRAKRPTVDADKVTLSRVQQEVAEGLEVAKTKKAGGTEETETPPPPAN